ncbi:hypothetical protein [Cellulomonas endophytica]|uniref:hypothetical protein n=1 Tax=Cellulomonas endophytica TaxID=2494735 RepID=UPI0010117DFE|nr:hypothetical protein [Cellulomonas endophytica]
MSTAPESTSSETTSSGSTAPGSTAPGSTAPESTAPESAPPAEPPVGTVTWWELPADDLAVASAFYGALFGWTFAPFGDDADAYLGIWSDGTLVGGLYRAEPSTPKEPAARVYVNVADLEAVLAAAGAGGGRVRTPRAEVGGDMGWWAELEAPDGRWLGVCTSVPARDPSVSA